MLMPVPVMVMESLPLVVTFAYFQFTPLWIKVAEVVLAVMILFAGVSEPLVTVSHFLSVSVPPFNFPSPISV